MSPVLIVLSISINKVIISNVFRSLVIVSYEQGKNKTEMLQLWLQIEHAIFNSDFMPSQRVSEKTSIGSVDVCGKCFLLSNLQHLVPFAENLLFLKLCN
jgi:hypothetical protein